MLLSGLGQDESNDDPVLKSYLLCFLSFLHLGLGFYLLGKMLLLVLVF